jgi:hypothetical protein
VDTAEGWIDGGHLTETFQGGSGKDASFPFDNAYLHFVWCSFGILEDAMKSRVKQRFFHAHTQGHGAPCPCFEIPMHEI